MAHSDSQGSPDTFKVLLQRLEEEYLKEQRMVAHLRDSNDALQRRLDDITKLSAIEKDGPNSKGNLASPRSDCVVLPGHVEGDEGIRRRRSDNVPPSAFASDEEAGSGKNTAVLAWTPSDEGLAPASGERDLGLPAREIWQRRLSAGGSIGYQSEHRRESPRPSLTRGLTRDGTLTMVPFKSAKSVERVSSPSCSLLERMIIHPSSRWRLAWELIGGALIGVDLVTIPLAVFSPPATLLTWTMDLITLLFWTVNMGVSCFAGYVEDGENVMQPKKILLNYLKLWFWIDMIVVGPDWVFFVLTRGGQDMTAAGDNAKLLRLLRMVRLARTVRLVRLLKLSWILDKINDALDSEATSIIANISKMILLLMIINHFTACLWFWLGSNTGHPNWVEKHHFLDAEWFAQYGVSFHWSITQFTPASMAVQPQNAVERGFAICVVIFALVGFSYIVGSITGSLTQLRAMKEEATKEFWKLRRYLKSNKIKSELSSRIHQYVVAEYDRRHAGSAPTSAKLLDLLSEQLQGELLCAMALPCLKLHPLFDTLDTVSTQTMGRLARIAISSKHYAHGDIVFSCEEPAEACYFVKKGKFLYSKPEQNSPELVDPGEDWVTEQALWCSAWLHLGQLQAFSNHNTLLLADPVKFGEAISHNPTSFELMQRYAVFYMARLNATGLEYLSDVSQGEDICTELRERIGEIIGVGLGEFDSKDCGSTGEELGICGASIPGAREVDFHVRSPMAEAYSVH